MTDTIQIVKLVFRHVSWNNLDKLNINLNIKETGKYRTEMWHVTFCTIRGHGPFRDESAAASLERVF